MVQQQQTAWQTADAGTGSFLCWMWRQCRAGPSGRSARHHSAGRGRRRSHSDPTSYPVSGVDGLSLLKSRAPCGVSFVGLSCICASITSSSIIQQAVAYFVAPRARWRSLKTPRLVVRTAMHQVRSARLEKSVVSEPILRTLSTQ